MHLNNKHRWQNAWWPSYRCIWRARSYQYSPRALRSLLCTVHKERSHCSKYKNSEIKKVLSRYYKLQVWKRIHIRAKVLCEKCKGIVVGEQQVKWTLVRPRRGRVPCLARERWCGALALTADAYFKLNLALHPLCETVGYARRAAANSRLFARCRRKEKWNAPPQWCGRARRQYTARGLQWSASQCRVSVASRTLELCCASPTPTAGLF